MATFFLPAVLVFALMSAPSALYDDKILTRIKINATSETVTEGGDFSIGCTLLTAEMSADRKKRATPEDDETGPAYFSSSFSYSDDDDQEEEEAEKQSSPSSRVQSQHVSTTSDYSEPTSTLKVASGNKLRALLSRIKVVNLELYRTVEDKTEVVARYDLTTQKVQALASSILVNGKQQYHETDPWKMYTTEMTVTYSQAQCNDTADFQCFAEIELDGETKYTTDFGLSVKVEPCEPCQNGSTFFDNNCYKVINQIADYETASKNCKQRGDHLVTISSDAENDFVSRLARNHTHSRRNLFIGLTHRNQSKVYEWTNGMKSNYRHWNLTQPRSRSGQSCAALGLDGMWSDPLCSNKLPYICEKPNSVQKNDNYDKSPHGCLPSWEEFRASCYKLYPEFKGWDDASKHCENSLAQLADIKTSAENAFIKAVAKRQNISDFYIGFRSRNREPRRFFWQSGEALTFTDWYPGEPNGNTEMCGHMYTESLQWDDMYCSAARSFMCEMPMYRKS